MGLSLSPLPERVSPSRQVCPRKKRMLSPGWSFAWLARAMVFQANCGDVPAP